MDELDYDFEESYEGPSGSEVLVGEAPGFDFLHESNRANKSVNENPPARVATKVTNSPKARMVADFLRLFPETNLDGILKNPSTGTIMAMNDQQLEYLLEALKTTVTNTIDDITIDEITRKVIQYLYEKYPKPLVDYLIHDSRFLSLVTYAFYSIKWRIPGFSNLFSIFTFLVTTGFRFLIKSSSDSEEISYTALREFKNKMKKDNIGLIDTTNEIFNINDNNTVVDDDVFSQESSHSNPDEDIFSDVTTHINESIENMDPNMYDDNSMAEVSYDVGDDYDSDEDTQETIVLSQVDE